MRSDSSSASESSTNSGSGVSRSRSSSSASSTSSASGGSSSDGEDDYDKQVGLPNATWLLLLVLFIGGAGLALMVINGKTGIGNSAGGESGETFGAGVSSRASNGISTNTESPPATAPASSPSSAADFLASIAAEHSMTPAALAVLPMPTSATDPAGAYVKKSWKALSSTEQSGLSFVTNPLGDSDEIVLQMEYPKGSYSATGSGGVGNMQLGVFGAGKNRGMTSYEVGFSKDFDFVKGGKLPGLFGGDKTAHCSGGRSDEACFSLRLMWRQDGAGEIYAYIPTYTSFCSDVIGSDKVYCHSNGFGASIHRGAFSFKAGSWNQVTQVAILNSDPDTANGYLALWYGTKLVIELTNVVFRLNASVTVSALTFSTFFGGSGADYAASADCWTYFRHFNFFEGDGAASSSGAQVQAVFGD